MRRLSISNICSARFPRVKHDIKTGLRCKWEISQRQYKNAKTLWGQLRDKSKPVHRALLRDTLRGLAQELAVNDPMRSDYEEELVRLDAELQSLDPVKLEFIVEDD